MNINAFSKSLTVKEYTVKSAFWQQKVNLVREAVVPYQWEVLNDNMPDAVPSHCVENFKIAAGLAEGKFEGFVFQDSDAAKWLEAVGYLLGQKEDAKLMETADGLIDIIAAAQQPDGYLDTYYIINGLDERFTNLTDNHELYCAGHMIEAGVAYFYGTGKRKLLDVCIRLADCIYENFGPEEGKLHGYPGHEIIELALVRLYQATEDEKYLMLSEYFIKERGKSPLYFEQEIKKHGRKLYWEGSYFGYQYYQAGKPLAEQTEAEGHAVRAVYLYAGMAALAKEKGDSELFGICEKLIDNITTRQMYITGAIGQSSYGEAFTFDYDLPNDTIYGETCASIGLVFFAQRMLEISPDRKYADLIEKLIYNGTISGMSAKGTEFFYVNPLEVNPKSCERDKIKQHVKPTRQKWFGCACCPPNIARMISSITSYAATRANNILYLHQYISGSIDTGFNGSKLLVESAFPWQGDVKISVSGDTAEYELRLRVPVWCDGKYTIKLNGEVLEILPEVGYIKLARQWSEGDVIELAFAMDVKINRSHPSVRENVGHVAVTRGPVVYCLEEEDNGGELHRIYLDAGADFSAQADNIGDRCISLVADAYRLKDADWSGSLYRTDTVQEFEQVQIKLIPYYLWANRSVGEMCVWVNEVINK